MPHFSHTEIVRASPTRIFELLDDVEATPSWLARCVSLERLTPGPTVVGTKLSYHYTELGRTGHMDGEVARREPNRRLTHTFTDRMMDLTLDFDLEPGAQQGTTNLTHSVDIRPKGLGRAMAPFLGLGLPAQTRNALTALKELVED